MKAFVKKDVDGFCGLFVDNLVQLLLIVGLGIGLCGMSSELLTKVVLPGTAISILVGNLFYAWQAMRLAKRTGRDDVTALPYGINTISLLVFVFFIIKPEYDRTGDPIAAWKMGVLACLISGIIELIGAVFAGPIRRVTPRAALLSTLAGIAISFISMSFALQIFQKPLISILPLVIVLIGLFSKIRLPLGLPSGLVAIAVGTGFAWLMVPLQQFSQLPSWVTDAAAQTAPVQAAISQIGWCPPVWCGTAIWEAAQQVQHWLPFLSIVIPMGIFSIIGSLQNIESAAAAGDEYNTLSSMTVNGLGTIVAACLGSCYPTTIYIGHPGWKEMGARAGYSSLTGLVTTALILMGLTSLVAAIVPVESGAAIVLWIGVIITAQAFIASPPQHAPAVAVGVFPAIAAWGATVMMGTLFVAGGQNLQQVVTPLQTPIPATVVSTDPMADAGVTPGGMTANELEASEDVVQAQTAARHISKTDSNANGFLIHALLVMERGYIFTCMILAAFSVCLIDRKFFAAGNWLMLAAVLTYLGVLHSYQVFDGFKFDHLFRFLTPTHGGFLYRADDLVAAYLLSAITMYVVGVFHKRSLSKTA